MAFTKRAFLALSVLAAMAVPAVLSVSPSYAQDPIEFRIGWQKGSNLSVIKARGEFEQHLKDHGISIRWIEFPAGPQMLEGLGADAIDFGVTGETPPVFAQAGGVDLVYAGNEPPSPKAEAILVPANSPIHSLAELKGKRIALNQGSNVHYFLVKALENGGLKYSDIKVAYLKPSDARAAFEKGAVDAWAIWDPYTTAAEAQVGARRLVEGPGNADNYNFYISTRTFAKQHPEVLTLALQEIDASDKWIANHLKESSAIVGPQIGLPNDVAERALEHYSYGASLLTAEVVTKQQKMADVLYDLKLIPHKLSISSVVWHPNS